MRSSALSSIFHDGQRAAHLVTSCASTTMASSPSTIFVTASGDVGLATVESIGIPEKKRIRPIDNVVVEN